MNKQESYSLSALGIACSLGIGKDAVARKLFTIDDSIKYNHMALHSGRSTVVRQINANLAKIPKSLSKFYSRNNQVLQMTLDEIAREVEQAKLFYGANRIGVVMATSTSGMLEAELGFATYMQDGSWPDSFCYTQKEIASPSCFTAEYLGTSGPNYTISTACSGGSKALFSAQRLIQTGICEAVICGGVDTLCKLTLNGFDSLDLVAADMCLPFSKNRQGINLGEAAGIFLLTKPDYIHSGAIHLLGWGESSDAYHISSPDPNGVGAEIAIRQALNNAALQPNELIYANLHGTATRLNDEMESRCIQRIFGQQLPCSSTKAVTGHTLGAAGALEAGFLWLALERETEHGIPLPPHYWDGEHDPELPVLAFVKPGDYGVSKSNYFALLSNSFAFGGSNASIILGKKRKFR